MLLLPLLKIHSLTNSWRTNNRNLDLSRTVRLSGISSGAKLELVVFSRSPSVVSVALQLPEADGQGTSRLTDKFPSTTTLWLVLRKFESAGGTSRNFTARGIPEMSAVGSGSGRLFFETPVIHIMGRELSSFTDLQKNLSQLGLNSGSTLLRLSFRATATPLEQAMQQIGQYFKEDEDEAGVGMHAGGVGNLSSVPDVSEPAIPSRAVDMPSPAEPQAQQQPQLFSENASTSPTAHVPSPPKPSAAVDETIRGPSQRRMAVFAPPSSSTPAAARQTFNEKDYEPTIDHAKLHQSRLSATGINKRLLSDAELAAQADAEANRNSDVKEVEIKIRFPDQTQVVSTFSNLDTAGSLYDFVTGLMSKEDEPFSLKFSAMGGPKSIPKDKDRDVKLITGLKMAGRVLVNVVWEEGASMEARGGRVLKEEFQEKAREIEVKEVEGIESEEKKQDGDAKGKSREEGKERKGGVPKWLKLPGKK